MPSLSEILNSNEGFTPVPGYTTNNNYYDNKEVTVVDHSVGGISGVTTLREIDAQYVVFKIPRRPDGFDLLNTHLKIYYEKDIDDDPYIISDDIDPINVMSSDDYILMGWLIPLVVTQSVGSFRYIIHAYKEENEELVYHWKSLPATYSISNTLIPGDYFVEPETSWYEDFIARMESYVSVVAGGVRFKGTIGVGGTVTTLPEDAEPGDQYLVITNGTYGGHACVVGDYLINRTPTSWVRVHEIGQEFINLAEAYAKGTIEGVPVTSSQPGYQDNSKYYKEQAGIYSEEIKDLTVSSETLTPGSPATVTKTGGSGVPYNFKFGIPKGDKGNTGETGPQGATGNGIVSIRKTSTSGLVDTYTITYTNGTTTTFNVTNGESGDFTDEMIRIMLINGVDVTLYNKLMKEWFVAKGCVIMTDLTSLVNQWYTLTRIGWNGGTKFAATTESSVSTGTAIGDNIGLNCTPSTNTVEGTDNYASLPMFAIKDANVTLDADGDPHVTAIDGIPSANAFARYDTTKVVEVLQMAPWIKYSEDATSYSWEYTDEIGKTGYIPWPSAVSLKDNSVRTWVHHVKYPFGDGYTACSGQKVRVWDVSHNNQLTGVRTAWGNKYCGKTSSDDGWVKHMTMIKYKSLTLDNIMNGCLSYYYNTVHPAIAEEDVERVIVAKSTGNAWLVGSTICIGSAAYTSKANQCSVVDRAKIVSVEDIEIEGTIYSAVNLDNGGVTFNTTTDLFVTTMQWYTGSTDNVLGNDGSPYSNTSTKEPYKIQGIEQIVGCYEVMGDTILSYIDGYQVPHVCRDASKLATSITADYKRCSFGFPQPASSGWQYSKKLGFDSNLPELLYPSESGGSSSTFTRDGYYIEAAGTTGLREWPAFGTLSYGLANGGLSCLFGSNGLAGTYWNIGGRLSSNGNRGEFEPSAA